MPNRKNTIIFCQSFGDITYTLAIISNQNRQCQLICVLPEIVSFFDDFYQAKKDKPAILLCSYPKEIIDFFLFPFKFRGFKNQLNNLEKHDVFFFSDGFDWISLSLIATLSTKNNIYLIDHYQNLKGLRSVKSFDSFLRIIYYGIMVGYFKKYFVTLSKNRIVVRLNSVHYKLIQSNPNNFNLASNPLVLLEGIQAKSILYVDSGNPNDDVNIGIKVREVLEIISSFGYNLYVKKHPNFGVSIAVLNSFPTIPAVPIELLDLSPFEYVVGIGSLALIRNNGKNKISILKLLYSETSPYCHRVLSFLDSKECIGEINYPSNNNDFISILKRKDWAREIY